MMRVASWNINSLRKRQDRLFAWLEANKPDIVCLQETKCRDEQFPVLALQAAGYHSVYHGEKSYNGVAILSKNELRDVRPSLCDEVVDPQARVIAATVSNIRVLSIYAPNGQRSANCSRPGSLTRCDCITKKAGFSVGGIIGCFRSRKIVDYASMQFWRANHWREGAPPPGSIGKCEKGRSLPIMRRLGQNLICSGLCERRII